LLVEAHLSEKATGAAKVVVSADERRLVAALGGEPAIRRAAALCSAEVEGIEATKAIDALIEFTSAARPASDELLGARAMVSSSLSIALEIAICAHRRGNIAHIRACGQTALFG